MAGKAVIWDMDGVIVDSGQYHFESWQEALGKRGVKFTEEQFRRSFGQRNDNIIRNTLGQAISRQEIDAIADEKEKGFRRRIGPNLKPLPGVTALMSSLKEHKFKMAVASSGPRENIQLLIRTVGITSYIETIVAGQDVTKSKPSPQIFLLAARKLGVAPAKCIVIEDSVAGVAAAKRAGMYCLAVTNTNPGEKLGEADLIVDSLAAVTVSELERLLISAAKPASETS